MEGIENDDQAVHKYHQIFMKKGLIFFLLFIYRDDIPLLTEEMKTMLRTHSFSA